MHPRVTKIEDLTQILKVTRCVFILFVSSECFLSQIIQPEFQKAFEGQNSVNGDCYSVVLKDNAEISEYCSVKETPTIMVYMQGQMVLIKDLFVRLGNVL